MWLMYKYYTKWSQHLSVVHFYISQSFYTVALVRLNILVVFVLFSVCICITELHGSYINAKLLWLLCFCRQINIATRNIASIHIIVWKLNCTDCTAVNLFMPCNITFSNCLLKIMISIQTNNFDCVVLQY